jgi:diacylglycerol kinase (ATP)
VSRAALVVNPAARGGAGAMAGRVLQALRDGGVDAELLRTATAGDGVRLAREAVDADGMSWVVALGGDGTAREVAQGLAEGLGTWPDGGRRAPDDAPRLLLLPAGTGNSMHKAIWDDRTWEEVLDTALRGRTMRRDLDLARFDDRDRAVLLGASAGFLRWAVEATERFPELAGRELYAAAGLAAAQELRPFAGRVSVDGRLLMEGPMALAAVGGARRRGGALALLPHSVLDDGLLDVCVLGARGPEDAITLLMAAMEGTHLEQPQVRYAQGHEVVLECLDGPLPFEHDGDPWPGRESLLRLAVVPHAVPVVSPEVWEE